MIFTELVERVPEPIPEATQTLILVHRRELVEQAARHVSNRYPERTVEIEMGSMHASGVADVTVASVQSITSRDRIDKFRPENFKLILVDEAHHIVAPNYLNVLGHFGLTSEDGKAIPALVGVSATMARFDGLALGKVIKHIVYHKDYIDMIGAEWLSKVIFTTVKLKVDLSKVKTSTSGDFLTPSLSRAINTPSTNLATIRAWQDRARTHKATLIFCVDLEHVQSLTKTFRSHGTDARFITGSTPKTLRASRLDAFKRGDFPVLLNCAVFTEGTDIPNIDCVLLARPTRSRNLLVQMIGRGMRLHPNKTDCHVIDMVASLESGIVTTPTLFGLDPDEMLNSSSHEDARRQKESKAKEQTQLTAKDTPATAPQDLSLHFKHHPSITSLLDSSSGERFIRALSPNTWVQVASARFILVNGAEGSYLDLEKVSEQLFAVKVVQKLPDAVRGKAPFARPRTVVKAETFESAVHGADTYAARRFARNFIVARGFGAAWREREASEAQVAFLNRFRDEGEELSVGEVSKGRANDMITKIKFGARGKVREARVVRRREIKEEKRRMGWERGRANEGVSVGPLDAGDEGDTDGSGRDGLGGSEEGDEEELRRYVT